VPRRQPHRCSVFRSVLRYLVAAALALAGLIALPTAAQAAAPAFVQGKAFSTSSRVPSLAVALPGAVGSGDLLVGWFAEYNAPGTLHVSDNVNGSWTRAPGSTAFQNDTGDIALYYVQNAKPAPGGLTVTVSGTWQSADQATVTSEYTSARVGTRNLVVAQTRNYTVQRSGDTVTATFTGQNVQVRGAVALAAQSNWTVVVNTAGTPDDPSDDTYTINGTQQSAGGTSVAQLNVSDAVLSPSCRRNPTSGRATIQQVSATRIRQEAIEFQSTCDGTAQLTSTTGGRSSVTLDFLE